MKLILLLIMMVGLAQSSYRPRERNYSIPYEYDKKELAAIHFWEKIFSHYSSNEILLFDSRNYIIYEVVKPQKLRKRNLTFRQKFNIKRKIGKNLKKKYRALLRSTYRKLRAKKKLSFNEKILVSKFKFIPGGPYKYLQAIRRLRSQQGQKDEILIAYKRAKPYLSKIERIFNQHKIPWEITRLPIIESMFQKHARSTANAVGVWQIIKSTGKRYLKFAPGYDPRKDPIKATYAAAKILRHHHRAIKDWPLTILSYNIGRYGTLRAIKRTNSRKISDIVQRFRYRTFGFSARNYFYELMALINVEKNFKTYFGKSLNRL